MYKIGQLMENRAKLYNWSYYRAIMKNDLDMIKYLHKKGYEYGELEIQHAIIKGNFDIFVFLYQHNKNDAKNQEDINILYLHYATIHGKGDIHIMMWLCENIQYKIDVIERTIRLMKLANLNFYETSSHVDANLDYRNPQQIEKWLSKYLRMRKLSQAYIL